MIRVVRNLRRSSRGQGLVEFALVIPLILLLVFGIYEFGRYYFTRLTLQHAVAEAARFAVTGNVLSDSIGDPMTRVKSITRVLTREARTLDVDVERIQLTPADGGGPGDLLRIDAEFSFQFVVPILRQISPENGLEFGVTVSMKNEPFISGGGS